MIHLDTSFLIRALVQGSAEDRRLRAWLRRGERLGMSAIAWAELLCGPVEAGHLDLAGRVVSERARRLPIPKENRPEILPPPSSPHPVTLPGTFIAPAGVITGENGLAGITLEI